MGVIKTQSIKSAIYTYIGVFLGFANSTLLMPNLLETTQVGLLSLLNSLTSIFVAFCGFGVPLITVKLFPQFRNSEKNNYFFSFTLLLTIIGSIIGVLAYLLLQDFILSEKNAARDFTPFLYGFIILFIAKLMARNMDAFNRMLYKTVLGVFLENFLLKILVTILLVTFWYVNGFDFKLLFFLYVIILATAGVFQLCYIIYSGEFNFNLLRFWKFANPFKKDFYSLSVFGLLGTLGSIIVLEVDKLMISNMISSEANAIYTISFFFGLFVNISSRGLKRIAQAFVSDAWKKNDLEVIRSVYRKSCLNQFLIGLYLFLGIWINIDYIFQFIPEVYSQGKYVILFIGIGQLTDMITGVNAEIIASSKFFRYNTYFIGSLIVLVIVLNWLLIPIYGIEGAAIASAVPMIFVNVSRFFFLNRKLNFQPLNHKVFLTLVIGLIALGIIYYVIPHFENPYWGILITGSTLTLLYWIPSLWLNISEDINEMIIKFIKRIS